jgi:hypothetical protein
MNSRDESDITGINHRNSAKPRADERSLTEVPQGRVKAINTEQ